MGPRMSFSWVGLDRPAVSRTARPRYGMSSVQLDSKGPRSVDGFCLTWRTGR